MTSKKTVKRESRKAAAKTPDSSRLAGFRQQPRAATKTFLRRALELARKGIGLTSPNPCVGAVIVDSEGQVVGEGSHTFEGIKHAEVLALEQAGDKSPRRNSLHQSRALLASGPHRALRRRRHRGRGSPGGRLHAGSQPAGRRQRVSSVCAMPESQWPRAFWKKKLKC